MGCITGEGQLSGQEIHTYVHVRVRVCVCFVYNATPSSRWQNPHFTKKLQAEIEWLSDHISCYSFHVLCLQSFIHTNICKQQNYSYVIN